MLQDFVVNFPFVWNEPEFTVIFFQAFMLYYKYVVHCLWDILCTCHFRVGCDI
jgi:hypothetical protein